MTDRPMIIVMQDLVEEEVADGVAGIEEEEEAGVILAEDLGGIVDCRSQQHQKEAETDRTRRQDHSPNFRTWHLDRLRLGGRRLLDHRLAEKLQVIGEILARLLRNKLWSVLTRHWQPSPLR